MKKIFLPIVCLFAPGYCFLGQSQTTQVEAPKSDTDLVKVYVRQDPATYQKTNQDEVLNLEFAVQLSASSKPVTDINSLRSWEELGPLYIHSENGLYKVRLGPFDTQEKAKEALLGAKARGKSDAFIVIQKGLENYAPKGYAQLEMNEQQTEIINPKPNTKQQEMAKPAIAAEANAAPAAVPTDETITEYKVRLASYLKPGGFSTKDVDQYGPLESYRQGEWTILMIGGFKTEQDAIRVRDLVIAKGFKDASVVADRGGILDLTH